MVINKATKMVQAVYCQFHSSGIIINLSSSNKLIYAIKILIYIPQICLHLKLLS